MPTIAKVAAKYRDKGVVFYAVDLKEEPNEVRKFLTDEKLDIPAILDRDGAVGDLIGPRQFRKRCSWAKTAKCRSCTWDSSVIWRAG